MEIPGLGTVTKDERFGFYYSRPTAIPLLGGKLCEIALEDYVEDANKEEFHTAIGNFLSGDPSILVAAEKHVFRYYLDFKDICDEDGIPVIESPANVWNHVQFGGTAYVSRHRSHDKKIYISLECECDWEPEHGLQIVFRNGSVINKVGQFDGHLTNSDAFANESLEEVVYRAMSAKLS